MKYLRNSALLALTILLTLTACQKRETFEVDANYCFQHMLPLMQFSVKYPADLQTAPPQPGQRNRSYNYFYKSDENSIEIESIQLGYMSLSADSADHETEMEGMLGQMASNYEEAGFTLEDPFTGTAEIDGDRHKVFRARGEIDRPEIDLQGRYLIQAVLLPPMYENNGLLIMMLAREDSPIQSFEDFAEEGSISVVWNTLEVEKPELPQPSS